MCFVPGSNFPSRVLIVISQIVAALTWTSAASSVIAERAPGFNFRLSESHQRKACVSNNNRFIHAFPGKLPPYLPAEARQKRRRSGSFPSIVLAFGWQIPSAPAWRQACRVYLRRFLLLWHRVS